MRTGVPVFILSVAKPRERSCSVMPCEAGSAQRPPGSCVRPICIRPFRKVPFVSTTALALNSTPRAVLTPFTCLLSSSKTSESTESCQR